MAHHNVFGELLGAKVEIAVLELKLVVDLLGIGDFKGSRLSFREDFELGDPDFDRSCSDFGVYTLTRGDHALCHKHVFVVYGCRLFKHSRVGAIAESKLNDSGAVAQVDEDKVAKVANLLGEAADYDLTGGQRDFRTVVGAA